jgi:hypothetical protein
VLGATYNHAGRVELCEGKGVFGAVSRAVLEDSLGGLEEVYERLLGPKRGVEDSG